MPRVGSWETERTAWSQGSQESPKKKALRKLIKQEFDSTHFITTETISPRVSKTVSVSNILFHLQTAYYGWSGATGMG